ncbi:hypothetical protein [Dyella flagellata]|uniref:hypothetical protein n=1 Tax=Dyella flagellata TaxID=1867833 RepID=UPI0024E146C9|nr:hypothetical protein [Dyella flagellata]
MGVVLAQKEIVHHPLRATFVAVELQEVVIVMLGNWTISIKSLFAAARGQALVQALQPVFCAASERMEF